MTRQLFTWESTIDDIQTDLLGNVSDDIKKIDITIAFNNGEYTYDLRTYRLNRK